MVSRNERNQLRFSYDANYEGAPLSLSMPVSNRIFGDDVVRPYLLGLLPDDERQRRAIAREYDVGAHDPVGLLAHIGLDCPGGVQLCSEDKVDSVLRREGEYRAVTDHHIARRLRTVRDDGDSSWVGRDESWSLGGYQGKFALANRNGSWCECLGSAPTTHIFKNGVLGFRLQALNEFVCMKTASRCGIPVAEVDYRFFEDEPALVVSRYDRILDASGVVVRLHQEDLCQSLSVMPDHKYTSDGGPTTADVLMLLAKTSHADINLELFTKMLFFNCLVGAPDAHAKNYSVLLGRGGEALLARMYDVASGLAYDELRRKGRLAMSIGGENRFGRVGYGAIARFAGSQNPRLAEALEQNGLSVEKCVGIMYDVATAVPEALASVFEDYAGIQGMDELEVRLGDSVTNNCARTISLL
jgi:serine/threonine-protein kinase HipA